MPALLAITLVLFRAACPSSAARDNLQTDLQKGSSRTLKDIMAHAETSVVASPRELQYERCASRCFNFWVGNGHCDDDCNVFPCNYDGGDCDLHQHVPAHRHTPYVPPPTLAYTPYVPDTPGTTSSTDSVFSPSAFHSTPTLESGDNEDENKVLKTILMILCVLVLVGTLAIFPAVVVHLALKRKSRQQQSAAQGNEAGLGADPLDLHKPSGSKTDTQPESQGAFARFKQWKNNLWDSSSAKVQAFLKPRPFAEYVLFQISVLSLVLMPYFIALASGESIVESLFEEAKPEKPFCTPFSDEECEALIVPFVTAILGYVIAFLQIYDSLAHKFGVYVMVPINTGVESKTVDVVAYSTMCLQLALALIILFESPGAAAAFFISYIVSVFVSLADLNPNGPDKSIWYQTTAIECIIFVVMCFKLISDYILSQSYKRDEMFAKLEIVQIENFEIQLSVLACYTTSMVYIIPYQRGRLDESTKKIANPLLNKLIRLFIAVFIPTDRHTYNLVCGYAYSIVVPFIMLCQLSTSDMGKLLWKELPLMMMTFVFQVVIFIAFNIIGYREWKRRETIITEQKSSRHFDYEDDKFCCDFTKFLFSYLFCCCRPFAHLGYQTDATFTTHTVCPGVAIVLHSDNPAKQNPEAMPRESGQVEPATVNTLSTGRSVESSNAPTSFSMEPREKATGNHQSRFSGKLFRQNDAKSKHASVELQASASAELPNPTSRHQSKDDADMPHANPIFQKSSPKTLTPPTPSTSEPQPSSWRTAQTPDGNTYYYNTTTHESTWVKPTE